MKFFIREKPSGAEKKAVEIVLTKKYVKGSYYWISVAKKLFCLGEGLDTRPVDLTHYFVMI